NSHADVIVTKFLEGCRVLDTDFQPRVEIASLYLDQVPITDTGRETAARHKVPVYASIEEALTLGGKELAVDGVLLIGEHGTYPYNEMGQHLYPRRRFFEEAVKVMRRSGRAVPVFSDKHLAYAWADAKWMYDTARALKMPLMAGSSLPVTWRKPEVSLPAGAEVTEAIAVGYGGVEAYGFHALETLQCMLERRKGGETGVKSVQCLSGEAVWRAADAGRWSWELLRAALSRSEHPETARATAAEIRERVKEPDAFLIEYRDGTRGRVLMLPALATEFLFAARQKGEAAPVSTLFWLQEGKPFAHFARLCEAIQTLFLTGKPPYPVERTLLTTGILDRVMQSRFREGALLPTPELGIRYGPQTG
ncbi:MAG TPA: hypothetical protein VFU47_01690, partial [Armatimonadota bacterium]|nr:hypothetical protein [Armatimonadota bacterium]